MYKRFDFECKSCREIFEEWGNWDINNLPASIKCTKCGNLSNRIISPVRFKLDGTDPAYSTEWDKWEKRRKQKIKLEKKQSA